MTQAFPIALFQHPLLLTLRAFHVLFGTDRKPFHCFTTWILTLMKEMLHLITEPLKRAPFPNEQTRRQCIPATLTSSAHSPWAAPACRDQFPTTRPCRLGSPFRTSRKHALPLSQHRIVPRFIFEISLASSTCSEMLWLEYPMANSEVSLCPEGIYVSQGVKQKKASCLGGHQLALKAFSELVSILLISF